VLDLVPEIALTPRLAGAFRARFGARVAIQHSALSDGERHDQWQRIRRGDVDVVVGTRSAVFAPLRARRLIVVDEEHEQSYKQDESPRYHGRDVARDARRMRRRAGRARIGDAVARVGGQRRDRTVRLCALTRRVLDRRLPRCSRRHAQESPRRRRRAL
jgi:primosomal protein N' (replication factor Y)